MRTPLLIFLALLCPLLLASCTPFWPNAWEARPWHEKNLYAFLKEQYPIGSEEKILIQDFTAHGYKFRPIVTVLYGRPPDVHGGTLTNPGRCSRWFGAWSGITFSWTTDKDGKITGYIQPWANGCLLTP